MNIDCSVKTSVWTNIDQACWHELHNNGLDEPHVYALIRDHMLTPLWLAHDVQDQVYHELWDNSDANR
jgi:hypothetical protein